MGKVVQESDALHPYELHRFVLFLLPCLANKTALDIGCGRGLWGFMMRTDKNGDFGYIAGVDIDRSKLEFCRKHKVYDDVVLSDAKTLPIKSKSIDLALACEVIEHLPKKYGQKFFNEINRITRETCVLTTPNGFLPFKSDNAYRIHLSGWNSKELRLHGFKVMGIGFKYSLLIKNPLITFGLKYMFTPLSYILPPISDTLVGVKNFS